MKTTFSLLFYLKKPRNYTTIKGLDATDIDILNLLQKNAELTNKEISFSLRKSIATVHERIKRLKEQGYIDRIVAILNSKKIDKSLIAFSQVLLNGHAADTLLKFENEVVKFPG
jgi:Lrp/AsnC family leucine-responsive transcriptional regulator